MYSELLCGSSHMWLAKEYGKLAPTTLTFLTDLPVFDTWYNTFAALFSTNILSLSLAMLQRSKLEAFGSRSLKVHFDLFSCFVTTIVTRAVSDLLLLPVVNLLVQVTTGFPLDDAYKHIDVIFPDSKGI